MTKKIISLTAAVLLLVSLFSCGGRIKVKLVPDDEMITIVGENTEYADENGQVVFEVSVCDGYTVDTDADMEYDIMSGKLTITSVTKSTTVKVRSRELADFEFSYSDDGGNVSSSHENGTYREGTVITLSCGDDKAEKRFACYTDADNVKNGGKILSNESVYTFVLTGNTHVVCNYVGDKRKAVVYYANGGVCGDGGDMLYTEWRTGFYLYANTLPDDGTFTRDGYILAGYGTSPDGDGSFYAPGWNLFEEYSGLTALYCIWEKETPADDFEFENHGGKLRIVSYHGDDEKVVIPKAVGGKQVYSIGSGAFDSANITECVMGRNIEEICDGAFSGCGKLEKLWLPDSIVSMGDDAVSGCENLSRINFTATIYPRYTGDVFGSSLVKVKNQRLYAFKGEKKLIVTSGSSSLYAFDTKAAEEAFEDYEIINFGTHLGTPVSFYTEYISHFLNPGDVLLHAPEPWSYQWGQSDIPPLLFTMLEMSYDVWQYVDVRYYDTVYSSFASYNKTRSYVNGGLYDAYTASLDRNGEFSFMKYDRTDVNYFGNNTGVLEFSDKFFTDENVSSLNRSFDMCLSAGADIFVTFSPCNKNAVGVKYRGEDVQRKYVDMIEEKYHITKVISDVDDYIFPSTYIYDADLHLTTNGCEIRMQKLIRDLKNRAGI